MTRKRKSDADEAGVRSPRYPNNVDPNDLAPLTYLDWKEDRLERLCIRLDIPYNKFPRGRENDKELFSLIGERLIWDQPEFRIEKRGRKKQKFTVAELLAVEAVKLRADLKIGYDIEVTDIDIARGMIESGRRAGNEISVSEQISKGRRSMTSRFGEDWQKQVWDAYVGDLNEKF